MTNKTPTKDLVVNRVFDANVKLVWALWTDPEKVKTWWGPKDYTSPVCQIDLREGGKYLFCMRAPKEQGGQDFYNGGVFKKIVPYEHLEFTQGFADEHGNIIPAIQMGMADMPDEILTVVNFKDLGNNKTEVTVTQYDQPVNQMFEYAVMGWNQSFDKMATSL